MNNNSFKSKNSRIEAAVMLIFAFVWNQIVYTGTKLIAGSWHHYDMTTEFDKKIPFLPWTVFIYFGCYIFWVINYYLSTKQNKENRDRYFCADALAKTVCLIIFLILPTTNIRPEITQSGILGFLMKFLYRVDTPDNLFPSIHCLVSWLCWIGVRKRKDINIIYRYFSLAAAVAVCISTITTRQHVIADVISGVLLAELCYYISSFKNVRNIYSKIIATIVCIFDR